MRDTPHTSMVVIRREAAHDFPAGADDAHGAVVAAEEQAVRAGADGRDVVALERGAGVVLVVVRQLDLGCVEEVEGSPLFCQGRELAASMEGLLRGEREDLAERGSRRGQWEGGRTVSAMVASSSPSWRLVANYLAMLGGVLQPGRRLLIDDGLGTLVDDGAQAPLSDAWRPVHEQSVA
jgi:hypothetical protein